MATSALAAERPLTIEDLEQFREDDGNRRELFNGVLVVTASPIPDHQAVVTNIVALMKVFVRSRNLGRVFSGPIDVRLSDHDVLVPDIVFVSRERAGIINRQFIAGAPDLVIEVLSPSSRSRDLDLVEKRALYKRERVREYWIIDPATSAIYGFTLENGDFEPIEDENGPLNSRVLDGFVFDPAIVFEDVSR